MILLDTSGLLAAIVADEVAHDEARRVLESTRPPRVLSPFVLAELEYLLSARGGAAAEVALLEQVAEEAYELASFDASDVREATTVIRHYRDLRIGLTDASIVVLAGRYDTGRMLTLDERHFRALRTPDGRPFTILPADA